jgi:hypothetical protein
MGIPDDLFTWYLLSTGWVREDDGPPPPGALVRIVFRSQSNNGYSPAYWEPATNLVDDQEAIRAAVKKFGGQPKKAFG